MQRGWRVCEPAPLGSDRSVGKPEGLLLLEGFVFTPQRPYVEGDDPRHHRAVSGARESKGSFRAVPEGDVAGTTEMTPLLGTAINRSSRAARKKRLPR